jgi:ubiquinone/menaquinone biosynthesis C-methylase UbiE
MSFKFYDKVAKKFGRYHTGSKYITEYPQENPKKVFKTKLLELSGKNEVALDIGCADGRFTLSIASHFKKIIAIDLSEGMLKAARKLQKQKRVSNVSFEKQNVSKTSYKNNSFDLIYSRRGPTPFSEAFRLLKPGGYFIQIGIGEQDCREVKEVFGRGQGFGQWDTPIIKIIKLKTRAIGFQTPFAREYFYNEYYFSYQDLDLFLQGVPIFEDFDSEKDKKLLEKYVNKFKTKKGIKFSRHRVVTIYQKPNYRLKRGD